ncbi:protein Niban 3 [Trichosurus vulpecula]|uniref:protein Niban 3 n=1 Tax=Trichosurus vulpecula TaxID=9337 RepID=UPI00186B2897|nr:protein Niban 3 [Trichosurus vulpecula]
MGAQNSSHLGERHCQYLRGRTGAFLNSFMPHYQRQLAMALLRQISRELTPQGQMGFQLLKSEKPPPAVMHEGILTHLQGNSPKWKESYCVLRGDSSLEWFGSKEEQRCGDEPQGSVALTGYTLVASWRECLYQSSTGSHSIQDPDPITEPPLGFPIYLSHPFRQPLCLCTDTVESQGSWKSILRYGIRLRGTVLQRRKSPDVEAFLDAVKSFRQEKGIYGVDNLLLGTDAEILTNLLMRDLLPKLRAQKPAMLRGMESRRKWAWRKFLDEVYVLVLKLVSSELQIFHQEKEERQKELEKKIRPEADQMLALSNQIAQRLQKMVCGPAESSLCQEVEPQLTWVMEELLGPVHQGFGMIGMVLVHRMDGLLRNVQRSRVVAVLKEEEEAGSILHREPSGIRVCSLGDMPWDLELMQPCYQKAELYWDSLQGLKERFGFRGTKNLVFSAQDLMQQVMENAVYTFQQLSEQHVSSATRRRKVICMLEKVKGRVLKKFESDSRLAQGRFVQEWLIQIFLPYLLRRLELGCRLELHKYEKYVFADYSHIITIENIYEDVVLSFLNQKVNPGMDTAAELRGLQPGEKKEGTAETCTHATLSTWNLETIHSTLQWDPDRCQDLLQNSHCEGDQEETGRRSRDSCSTHWPPELLDKDPDETERSVLLEGLTIAMDMDVFQTDLLEMGMKGKGSLTEWSHPTEFLKSPCTERELTGSGSQAGDTEDGIYSNVAVKTLPGGLGKGRTVVVEIPEGEISYLKTMIMVPLRFISSLNVLSAFDEPSHGVDVSSFAFLAPRSVLGST